MSDTPLTDAKIKELEHMPHSFLAAGLAITARELERKLNEARRELEETRKDRKRLDWLVSPVFVIGGKSYMAHEARAAIDAERKVINTGRKEDAK